MRHHPPLFRHAAALLPAAVLAVAAACARPAGLAAAPGAAAEAAGEWQPLFDGSADLSRWRGYQRPTVPAAWRAEQGTLVLIPIPDRAERGDLVTREQFGDFELEYEWRVAPGANSGVMWRVTEDQERSYFTGPEMQVLDDERHGDARFPSHRAGALYDLVVPPAGVTKPVGEFNQARIVARGGRVQLFLNGRPTADVDFDSDAGRRLVAGSKFKDMPRFARNRRGHIVLQDHGDTVYFRRVRIRPLGGAVSAR